MTRKITRALARIKLGTQDCLYLGNMDALRDWGHARDYVEGMWRMLQHDTPDDYVLATGKQYSVRDFVNASAQAIGMKLNWEGEGVNEIARDENGQVRVAVDPRYFRPAEVETLSDPTKAKTALGWEPKVSFEELVQEMSEADLLDAKREKLLKESM